MGLFNAAQLADIIQRYQAGDSLATLAARYFVSVPTIQATLKRAGIERRPRGGLNNPNGRRGKGV